MRRLFMAAGVIAGGLAVPASPAAAQDLEIGGPDEPLEATVHINKDERSVRAKVRADLGDVEVGPIQADIRPRIGEPGDEPPAQQYSGNPDGSAPEEGETQIAPVNLYARPRVGSPGNDGDREQENPSESQIAPVNADVSPRIFSEGDSGERTQRNGAEEADDAPADEEQPPPEDPTPIPVVGPVVDSVRPRPGRRGLIDLVAVNADISPRIGSDGNDGARNQRNGYDGSGNAEDEVGHDNQVVAVNLIVAPDVLSNGGDGPVEQWNGSNDDQAVAVVNGDATTGAGDQVLTDNQVLPVNALVATNVLSDGDDGAVRQHNGSEDSESASTVNSGGADGDATTGSGDQVLTDDQVVPVNLVAGGAIGSTGNSGGVSQHNGSDDDQQASVVNAAGSDGNASTGSGDETLTDLQLVPVNLLVAPDLGSEGDDGAVFQHNGSDDDEVVTVVNAGETGGDGSAGAGDEVLTDLQAVPVAAAVTADVGSTGNDGDTFQHNGSDDDQLVTVTNGVGADGNGEAGAGDQTLVDLQAVPVTGAVAPDVGGEGSNGATFQHNGSDDDQEVHITNAGAAGGDGQTGAGDQTLVDPQAVPVTAAVSPDLGQTGDDGPMTQHNGSDDDQLVTVTNGVGADGSGETGAGDQTLVDEQLVPLVAAVNPDAGGEGSNGATSQHNGSDDDQEVHITNAGAAGGDGETGAGDQTLVDLQAVPVTGAVSPDLGQAGGDGPTTQHNGSDDDQLVTVTNGPGADGGGTTGDGGQVLVDLQAVPLAAVGSPTLGGDGTDEPTTQHNGSDDDQEVHVTNVGPSGGGGETGGGGQTLADDALVPATASVPGGAPASQQNGSDDDQLVVVKNGPGAGGTGRADAGPRSGDDVTLVPIGVIAPKQSTGTGDDVQVIVTTSTTAGAPGVRAPARRQGELERRRRERQARRRDISTGGGDPGPGVVLVKGDTADSSELPRTGGQPLPLAVLGLAGTVLGAIGRRRTRRRPG